MCKLPWAIRETQEHFKVNYREFLGTNPKTEKSEIPTRILHLAPAKLSGKNLCPGAGNCEKICLHFSGNPAYFNAKQASRMRKAKLYNEAPMHFLNLLTLSIAYEFHRNDCQPMAVRLNGTSDLKYEDLEMCLSDEVAAFIGERFGLNIAGGFYNNIFEVFRNYDIRFYDYTKIRRNWAKCKALGYHLTFSFDGHNNTRNIKLCRDAFKHGLNIAAAFNIRKGHKLPDVAAIESLGISAPVYDGDLSDYRPNDPTGHVIGLRFKIPRKLQFSPQDVAEFCAC